MSVIRFDPLRGFENLSKKMGNLVDEFEKGFSFEYGSFAPRVDIAEDEKSVYFHAELPGIRKEDVKVSINDDNILTIKGTKKRVETEGENQKNFIRLERTYGEFTRSFVLPENINTDSISAKFDNGVLEVTLQKKEPSKPKEVEVKII